MNKNFSDVTISLFVDLCLECVVEGISTLDRTFIQKAAQRIENTPNALGFAELCLMENAGENLPEVVSAALKKRFVEYENDVNKSIDVLRTNAKNAEEYAKRCRALVRDQEIKMQYLQNALRSFPSC